MLSVGWVVAAIAVAVVLTILLTMWTTFTLTRLDRLHARVDAAQAAMDTQLVRRAAALQHMADTRPDETGHRYEAVARAALAAGRDTSAEGATRETAENAVGRAVRELAAGSPVDDELREAAARVLIARRFYNDAVRDTRSLRDRRLPRVFRMAGRREMPQFFDIDDTLPVKEPR